MSDRLLSAKRVKFVFLLALLAPVLAACGGRFDQSSNYEMVGQPYTINGRLYVPHEDPYYSQVGQASWYGRDFHGQKTANGEIYNVNRITAAHTTLPLPSYVRVTNLENGSSIVVRLNDRGPFANDRIIDLSERTAELLGMHDQGIANVQVDFVGMAPLDGDDQRSLMNTYQAPGERNVRVRYDPDTRSVSSNRPLAFLDAVGNR